MNQPTTAQIVITSVLTIVGHACYIALAFLVIGAGTRWVAEWLINSVL